MSLSFGLMWRLEARWKAYARRKGKFEGSLQQGSQVKSSFSQEWKITSNKHSGLGGGEELDRSDKQLGLAGALHSSTKANFGASR